MSVFHPELSFGGGSRDGSHPETIGGGGGTGGGGAGGGSTHPETVVGGCGGSSYPGTIGCLDAIRSKDASRQLAAGGTFSNMAPRNAGAVVERASCSCSNSARLDLSHAEHCPDHIRRVREVDLKHGLLPVPFRAAVVGPGETVRLEANPMVMLRGPYYLAVTATGAPDDPVLVEDVHIGNQMLAGNIGASPMSHYVLDSKKPWPGGLVPLAGPVREFGVVVAITVRNSSCASREFMATLWGRQIHLDEPKSIPGGERAVMWRGSPSDLATDLRELLTGAQQTEVSRALAPISEPPRHLFKRQPSMDGEVPPPQGAVLSTVTGRLTVRPEPALLKAVDLGVRWFGPAWDAEICKAETHAPLPPGECKRCGVRFQSTSRGLTVVEGGVVYVSYHLDCYAELLGLAFGPPINVKQTDDAPRPPFGGKTVKAFADELLAEQRSEADHAKALIYDRMATAKHLIDQATPLDSAEDAAWESPNDEWP